MTVSRRACLTGVPFLLFSGCLQNGDTIRIDLFVTSKTPLRDVYAEMGAEKYMWPSLAPEERGTLQVRLFEPQILTLRYRLAGGNRVEWKSASVDPYKIRVLQADLSTEVTARLIPR